MGGKLSTLCLYFPTSLSIFKQYSYIRNTWEGNYQLYVYIFPVNLSVFRQYNCIRNTWEGNYQLYIYIFPTNLSIFKQYNYIRNTWEGNYQLYVYIFPVNLSIFRQYNCIRNTWEGNYQLYVDIFRPAYPYVAHMAEWKFFTSRKKWNEGKSLRLKIGTRRPVMFMDAEQDWKQTR